MGAVSPPSTDFANRSARYEWKEAALRVIGLVFNAFPSSQRPPMPQLTRPAIQLSLLITPMADQQRDNFILQQRVARLEDAQQALQRLTLTWANEREPGTRFIDFEGRLIEASRQVACASTELMLALAEVKNRRETPDYFDIGDTVYRMASPEPRSLTTWFGTIRYNRSYARPVEGGPGWFPLDAEMGLLSDRISPSLLLMGARLATRVSFEEAREILGWFVPQPPSTSVLQQTVLGLGHHTQAWFESVAPPDDDGEVLVVLIDGKCVPTVRDEELEKRSGPRKDKLKAPSPRHRGRANRKLRGRRPRPKQGDKTKNGKLVTMVVIYTLRREGKLLLGPLNRRVYASFGPKRHAFEFAVAEAARRGFGAGTDKTVQLLTDGDPDLHRYVDEYFPESQYPQRVVTVDIMHVLEKLWDAGTARYAAGSDELATWVHEQEDRLYGDDAAAVVGELRGWLAETPKVGPGNKGKRKRLSVAIRYVEQRLDKLSYGTCQERDLEVGTGQVEGAIKHVIGKRCDHGGMRWKRERAQAVIQLRCIDVNEQWDAFATWALQRLQARAQNDGRRIRLQTNSPAKLPSRRTAA
jgi:hypothetical protein